MIQYASDLHLEFPQNREYLQQHPIMPIADTLVLAGDIVPFAQLEDHTEFFRELSENFETVYWLPGNHEYYHFDIAGNHGSIHKKVTDNIHLVNNTSVVDNGVKYIFTTLWSSIAAENKDTVKQMSDFKLIQENGTAFSPDSFNRIHNECFEFLADEVYQPHNGPVVVVTHHVPTMRNYPKEYHGDPLNDAFAVELQDLMAKAPIDHWIYGHHHRNIPEFTVENTQLHTNQLGYVQMGEGEGFDGGKTITD